MGQELLEALDGVGMPVGALPDLHQPGHLIVHEDGSNEDHVVGGVAGSGYAACRGAAAGMRGQMQGLALGDRLAEQLVVGLPVFFALIQADLVHVDLVLELQIALRRAAPNRGGRRRQGGKHALEKFGIVVGRQHVLFRQLRYFFNQAVDLLAGFFNQGDIGLRLGTCTHRETSFC